MVTKVTASFKMSIFNWNNTEKGPNKNKQGLGDL